MSKSCVRALFVLAGIVALWLPANAQSVVSTHSGVIYFFEGAVYLGDQPLDAHLGKFASVPQGAELRTVEGRAEVLLTPGVFLRMGERSAIRMIANSLADTQVELQTGSAIVESGEPNGGTSVTLIYQGWRVHILQKGVYRIDCDPPHLWVREGEAEVVAGPTGRPVSVESGMSLAFGDVLAPERSSDEPSDALSDWANGRSESITADNAITAQIDEDPTATTPDYSDGFTYFPFLGVPSVDLGPSGLYSSSTPYQPGFSSIYLPGYTYPPLMLGIIGVGIRTRWPSTGRWTGGVPGAGTISPLRDVPYPGVLFPRAPLPGSPVLHGPVMRAPAARPAPVYAPPHIGMHGGVHR